MDQAMVVKDQVKGGAEFLARLQDTGFRVTGAVWAKTPDDGIWYLHVISPEVAGKDRRPSYLRVRKTLRDMEGEWKDPFERVDPFAVMLTDPDEPLARGVLNLYERYPNANPLWPYGAFIGSVYVEGAYVYPPTLFAPPETQPTA